MNLLGNLLAPRTSKSRRRTNQGMHDTEEAIMRSEENTKINELYEMECAIELLAKSKPIFRSEEVWGIYKTFTGNRTALGGVMRRMGEKGVCTPRGMVKSHNKSRHFGYTMEYRSKRCTHTVGVR
mgnify:CR=1 FL=1